MLRHKRNLILDIYDYSGNKLCTLYDGTQNPSGQAHDVIVKTQRNGWKELSFSLPSTYENENGIWEDNYRASFLKADYRIRAKEWQGEDKDNAEIDWYLISEPKVSHEAFSKDISVRAGHIQQLLKTKNLGLEFSDEEGNNVGTAEQLLATILDGTGWGVGHVAEFLEKRGGAVKIRSMKASAKTGAFKLISNLCDLFEAKPIYHGGTKKVDIVPMNPFSVSNETGLPTIANEYKGKVIELHYGKNVKNVQRTLNTENLVTKLYAYGAYGDKTSGYCGIDEWVHTEYKFNVSSLIAAGTECKFEVQDQTANMTYIRYFTAQHDIAAGSTLTWSVLDPASMLYVWDGQYAHRVYQNKKTSSQIQSIALQSTEEVVNKFQFLMDFDYYNTVDLLTDNMVQEIAYYQRNMPSYLTAANEAQANFAQALTDISEVVGSIDFCKLNVSGYNNDSGYLQIVLNKTTTYPNGVIYRTDYSVRERKQFKWRVATELKPNGDPLNEAASIVYIVHTNTNPYTYDLSYLKDLLDNSGNNVDADGHPDKITLWTSYLEYNEGDQVYLFKANTINGLLGALQASDEATVSQIESATKTAFTKHPVYYQTTSPSTADFLNYGWWWNYSTNPSQLLFCYKDLGDSTWFRTAVTKTQPSASDYRYWYDWSGGVLYVSENGEWKAINESPEQQRLCSTFGTVYSSCKTRDRNRVGYYQFYKVNINNKLLDVYGYNNGVETVLPVGNYVIEDEWGTYHSFTTKTELTETSGAYIVYDSSNHWVVISPTDPRNQSVGQVIDQTVEVKDFKFDNVFPNSDNILSGIVWEEGQINAGTGSYKPGSQTIVDGGGDAEGTGYRSGFCNAYPGIKYKASGDNVTAYMYTIENQFLGSVVVNNNETFITQPNTRHVRFTTESASYANIVCGAVNSETSFIVDEEAYNIIGSLNRTIADFPTVETSGRLKGIIPLISQFVELQDMAYITSKGALDAAQQAVKAEDERLVNALGDIYREGYWQKNDYVDGDEDKLYADALENLEKISKPEATYNISYLDLYGENDSNFEYGASDIAINTAWPDISYEYAAHLIDEEIGISQWAFLDTVAKCYDQPQKTSITINTNLSTIAQHTFTDVLTNIANVASQVSGKMEVYERAAQFDEDGMTSTSNLEGRIDANKLLITGGSSTWYTDDKGNMVFESADGKQAMTLTGNGFSIANSKDQYGDWNWRTFGTGEGFTADLITAGTLEADRVITNKLLARLGETLRIAADHVIISDSSQSTESIVSYTTSLLNEMDSKLSSDITTMGSQLSSSISQLDTRLSSDIGDVDTRLSGSIEQMGSDLSDDIDAMGDQLSTDISNLNTQLSGDISQLESDLTDDINSVDTRLSSNIDQVDMRLQSDIDSVRTDTYYKIDATSNDLYSAIELQAAKAEASDEALRGSIADLRISNDNIIASVRIHDTKLGDIGTHVIIDPNGGLRLRQDQAANYEALLSADTLSFRQIGSNGNALASFGIQGAYIDKIHSNKVLSVGSEESGWFDTTQMNSGSLADKWRNGTEATVFQCLITQQPVNYIGSSPQFTTVAENATNYQWQRRERYDGENDTDNPWTDIANANSQTYSFQQSQSTYMYEYRCHVYNSGSHAYSRAVCVFDKDGPSLYKDLPKTVVDSSGEPITIEISCSGSPTYTWYKKTAGGNWQSVSGSGNTLNIVASSTTTYYRCDLESNGRYASTRVCKVVIA